MANRLGAEPPLRATEEAGHGETRVAVVYQQRELMPPQVRAFIDVLVAWAPTAIGAGRVTDRRWPPKPEAKVKMHPRPKRRARRSRINRD